jgi:transposase
VLEQRENIKFCFKPGKTATETFQLITQAYGDNALSRTRVFEWYARFRDGRENLEDDERSGRPTAVRTPDMIEIFHELISSDRRMTLRMMEEEVLSGLVQRIRRVRPQFQERGSWFPLARQRETSHCSINKAFYGKTSDFRIK